MSAQAAPPSIQHELDFAPAAALVARALPGRGQPTFEPMPGGASTRRYFRVHLGGRNAVAVAMFVPDGAKPEEVGKGEAASRWPFLEVRELLHARGVDVPALLGEDTSRGWLLLEDLGDDTLAAFLAENPARKEALYVRAVTDLARAQTVLASLPPGSVVATRAFDDELLRWEIDHFREWALEARGITLTAGDRATFDAVAGRLARRIAAWPRAFVHRDYQSRNLMVRASARAGERESLCWLDFQDALLGPRIYDIVALLNDSYQTFDRAFVEARLDDYAGAHGLSASQRADVGREFDLVTVQRKLKDAGRFVFIDRVKKNPSFLRFVEPTIEKVRASLARLQDDADMRALAAVLARALPATPA
jgi:aminoglycoside/choline kinase family phosphotransferase